MKDFELKLFDYFSDKHKIVSWQRESKQTPEYKKIKKYIIHDFEEAEDLDTFLSELEDDELSSDRVRHSYIAETENGEAVGFLSFHRPREHRNPGGRIYIEFLMVNPKYQNQGYGTAILEELFTNISHYALSKPETITTMFKKKNESVKHLFEKFGFDIKKQPLSFYSNAEIKMDTLENNIEQLKQENLSQPE